MSEYETRAEIADKWIPKECAIDRFRFIYGNADEVLLKYFTPEGHQAVFGDKLN